VEAASARSLIYDRVSIKQRFGGKADIALLTLPENQTLTIRVQGIIDSLKKFAPAARIVAQQRAQAQNDAETVMENILTAHPSVRAILGWSDTVILGAVSALENRGKDPSKYVIVGIDATKQALAALQAGKIQGTVNNPPDKFGALAFAVCYGLITDPNSPWHFVQHAITELSLVTRQNLGQFMK
jgi:ABC-type sugar transport system substrate-binding protein